MYITPPPTSHLRSLIMKFTKQADKFSVIPIRCCENESGSRRHGPLLPPSIRCIICGPSNCGKTNLMMSLLLHPKGLQFRNCYVYSKSLQQPKYQFLGRVLDRVPGMGRYFFDEREDVVPPEKIESDSIIIFDDVACEKQDIIRDYFSMGRHSGVDSFYLCQSYTRIPKHLIRDNANLVVLFRQDDLNVKHVYDDHVTSDMSLDYFREMCRACWEGNKYGHLIIDSNSQPEEGRYRRGLDEYIRP